MSIQRPSVPPLRTAQHYSLMRGGLVYGILHKALHGNVRRVHFWLAVLLSTTCLLPIALASLLGGTFYGDPVDVPLLLDFSTMGRFLMVLPLLVIAAPQSDRLMRRAIAHIPYCGLIRHERQAPFDRLLSRIWSLRDPRWPEVLLLFLAFTPILFMKGTFDAIPGVESWRSGSDAMSHFASGWMDLVALPLFRFVVLLWLWRFAMWTYFLWRLSWLHLRLDASHPDGSGGILFLGESQFRFAALALAGGILVSANCLNHVVHLGESIEQQKPIMIGYVLLSVGFLVAPAMLLGRRLFRVKQQALLAYSKLGHQAASGFGARWLDGNPPKSLLDSGDPSALADYGSVYATVRGMSIFPMTRTTLLWFFLIAALPFLPLWMVAMPLDELLNRLVAMVA